MGRPLAATGPAREAPGAIARNVAAGRGREGRSAPRAAAPAPRAGRSTVQRVVRQIVSGWRTQAIGAAVQLGMPDRLAGGPMHAPALAALLGASPDGVLRLLRALCALGLCRQRRDGRFTLNAAGQLLCERPAGDVPNLRALALWWGGPVWPMWAGLADSVRTGASARERQTGVAHYGFLDDAETAAVFHAAMRALTALLAPEVAALDLWHGARTLVDVGGGHGELTAAVLDAHPRLRAIVLDRPDAAPGAQLLLAQRGFEARARFLAGDFFADLPAGADRYLLKSILHNWDDAHCRTILARCAQAAPRGAHLVLVERVRPERLRPTAHDEALARTDLNMLAGLGGRERSLRELEALLAPAGFEAVSCVPTRHEFSVVDTLRR